MLRALLAALLLAPLWAKPLIRFDDLDKKEKSLNAQGQPASDQEVAEVQDELDEIQRQIRRKEIPNIEFEFDKALLKDSSNDTLQMVADLLIRHPSLKLWVTGHTCNLGSKEYNRELSQRRAEAVKDRLIEFGVLGESIRAKGFGFQKPIAPNDTEENRSLNRRVEFTVLNRWWNAVY
ncbi:MAG TPA: hypothetical protein DCM05_17110 [Elusimicrobia bacterium]|nr:hypothetical protein [Elusimicrobiota bacterium]